MGVNALATSYDGFSTSYRSFCNASKQKTTIRCHIDEPGKPGIHSKLPIWPSAWLRFGSPLWLDVERLAQKQVNPGDQATAPHLILSVAHDLHSFSLSRFGTLNFPSLAPKQPLLRVSRRARRENNL